MCFSFLGRPCFFVAESLPIFQTFANVLLEPTITRPVEGMA